MSSVILSPSVFLNNWQLKSILWADKCIHESDSSFPRIVRLIQLTRTLHGVLVWFLNFSTLDSKLSSSRRVIRVRTLLRLFELSIEFFVLSVDLDKELEGKKRNAFVFSQIQRQDVRHLFLRHPLTSFISFIPYVDWVIKLCQLHSLQGIIIDETSVNELSRIPLLSAVNRLSLWHPHDFPRIVCSCNRLVEGSVYFIPKSEIKSSLSFIKVTFQVLGLHGLVA